MMNKIKLLFSFFERIITGIVIFASLYILIFWNQNASDGVAILWQIILVALLSTFGLLFMPCMMKKEVSKYAMLVRSLLYYCYVNVCVLLFGFYFEWFYADSLTMIIGMEGCIACVFIFVTVVSYIADQKTAKEMNLVLSERNKECQE